MNLSHFQPVIGIVTFPDVSMDIQAFKVDYKIFGSFGLSIVGSFPSAACNSPGPEQHPTCRKADEISP